MRKDVQDQLVREFLSTESPTQLALKEIIEDELATLHDINLIDTDGSLPVERIGQEVLARQKAYKVLKDIFNAIGLGLKDSSEPGRNRSFR